MLITILSLNYSESGSFKNKGKIEIKVFYEQNVCPTYVKFSRSRITPVKLNRKRKDTCSPEN